MEFQSLFSICIRFYIEHIFHARNFIVSPTPTIRYVSISLLNIIKWVKTLLNRLGLLNVDISNKQESPLHNPQVDILRYHVIANPI